MEEREHGEGLIARALQLVVNAEDADRDYTDDELEEVMFCLTMAAVKFKKIPGGKAAAERVYARAEGELARRGVARVVSAPRPVDDHDRERWRETIAESLPKHELREFGERQFVPCYTCSVAPGCPSLCRGCLANRQTIAELREFAKLG